jgi:hypothetical protein
MFSKESPSKTPKVHAQSKGLGSFTKSSLHTHPLEYAPLKPQKTVEDQDTRLLPPAGEAGFVSIPPIAPQEAQSPGEPLDPTTRISMAQRFGHNFSDVRIYADEEAAESAKALNARAYTIGQHIVFGSGQYATGTREGRTLLAHELTHVVQQRDSVPSLGTIPRYAESNLLSRSSDVTEREANSAAAKIVSGDASVPRIQSKSAGVIQRQGVGAVEVAGAVLAGMSVVQDRIQNSQGGLTYTSDQITYPRDLERVVGVESRSLPVAEFNQPLAMFTDTQTIFYLHGDFGRGVMANVYIDVEDTTTYSTSLLSFSAKALQTPYGTPEDPRIRFVCTGRFDPAGFGDCGYRVVLEVDQTGHATPVERTITSGEGFLGLGVHTGVGSDTTYVNGFSLVVY